MAAASDSSTTEPLSDEGMKTLLGQVDRDGDGQVSGNEITAFVTQLGSQMQAASAKYSSTAMPGFSTNQVNEAA